MDFTDLYKLYATKIFRVCLGYFNDAERAKDITQETFITVFEHLDSLENKDNISGWIYRIATNKCLRQLENEKRTPFVSDFNFSGIADSEPLTEENKFVKLRQCINELPEPDRILIGLYLEEVSQDKIAEIMGLSHSYVRVKIHRIKEILFQKMKSHE